ncbi:MAG: phosphodiester glycosidase family protein [Candidatus Enterenecus sp.]
MKQLLKRISALILTLSLLLALLPAQRAAASWAIGTELVDRSVELSPGLTLTSGSLWSASRSDLRTEHYLTYTPGGSALPMVYSGTYVASTGTVTAAARAMEAQGWRVAAAVNGGFFNADGTIVGMLVTDGVLRSAAANNYAMVGFTWDGQVFVDESPLVKTAEWALADGSLCSLTVTGFNAYRAAPGLYLYNRDFSSRVISSGPCVYAILRPVSEEPLTINSTLTMEVVSVTDATQEGVDFQGEIPEGCYMLYGETDAGEELLTRLRELTPGAAVSISVTGGSEQWSQAAYGLTALQVLVRDGATLSGLDATAAPRTAVGLRPDGTAVFYTIDGRQSGYSVGASYTQVADRLIELGCTTAVALDGGGSTTLGATLPGSGSFSIVNRPSTSNRSMSNCILFLVPDAPAGELSGLYLSAGEQVVLAGASMTVSAAGHDTEGRPAEAIPDTWSAEGGVIELLEDGSTRYTAGEEPGVYELAAFSGSAAGTMPVRVVTALAKLTVTRQGESAQVGSLTLAPGEQVSLAASGAWYNLPTAIQGAVTWETEGNIGSIDGEGNFTAVNDNGTGAIRVSAGGQTVTIPVTVDRGDPFTDMGGHWSTEYVTRLYQMGITVGILQPDGTYTYNPGGQVSRGELLVFLTRLLGVDTSLYESVELPFADAADIPAWMLPSVKAMYALQVFEGTAGADGVLTANVKSKVTREAAMTMLGRVLRDAQSCDLSGFEDSNAVSSWAAPHVQTLVAEGIVVGSGGRLNPRATLDRASIAKLLVEVSTRPLAELTPRDGLGLTEQTEPEPTEPEPTEPEPTEPEPTEPEPTEPEPTEPEPAEPEPTEPAEQTQEN